MTCDASGLVLLVLATSSLNAMTKRGLTFVEQTRKLLEHRDDADRLWVAARAMACALHVSGTDLYLCCVCKDSVCGRPDKL